MKKYLPYLTGISAALLWGAWFPITRYSAISSLGAVDTMFLRFSVGCLIALPLLYRSGFKIQQKYSFWKTSTLTLGSGIGYVTATALGFLVVPASYAMVTPICIACQILPVSKIVLLTPLAAIFTLFFQWILLGIFASLIVLFGSAIVLVGIYTAIKYK